MNLSRVLDLVMINIGSAVTISIETSGFSWILFFSS